jgi:hypothetical protein
LALVEAEELTIACSHIYRVDRHLDNSRVVLADLLRDEVLAFPADVQAMAVQNALKIYAKVLVQEVRHGSHVRPIGWNRSRVWLKSSKVDRP